MNVKTKKIIYSLILLFLISCNHTNSENENRLQTALVHSDGGSVYEMNLESSKEIMTFNEAQKYASSYGDNWRLPTLMELITLRYNGGNKYLDISTYWSSDVSNDGTVKVYNFYIDKSDYEMKNEYNYVILVRKVK